tara:strand:+ start:1265 stop:1462 length:198 start_codon:yes stop_codon:yes gene_type:complete
MNKKGFITTETFGNIGFWVLLLLGWSATILGYTWSKGMDSGALPLWQILVTLVVIFFAAAFFARE